MIAVIIILIGIILLWTLKKNPAPTNSILPQLQKIARIDIQVDYHKIFGQSTLEYMNDKELDKTSKSDKVAMIANDSVIRVECLGKKQVLIFSHDLEIALNEAYKELTK